jgi:hypothetical protein
LVGCNPFYLDEKMKKITFSFIFLGLVFFFSACNWKKLSPEEENERILM